MLYNITLDDDQTEITYFIVNSWDPVQDLCKQTPLLDPLTLPEAISVCHVSTAFPNYNFDP